MNILPSQNGAAQQIALTLFPDIFGKACTQESFTYAGLANFLRNSPPEAINKASLPLLKFATFGELRSPAGSLRHDANVTSVTGCEIDYDLGVMPIETAFQELLLAGIEAILYTSPSYTTERPRWRVLAPLSVPIIGTTEQLREGRSRCVARINHVLGGVVAPESFALSQAFYYGRVSS